MKTQLYRLIGMLFLLSMISCEKSTELDVDALTMELESCKPDKKNLNIGMEYQGGIIFYLDESGRHGKIVAKEDLGPAPWGCFGTSYFEPNTGYDAKTASKIILNGCKERCIAVRLCAKYEVREKGKHGRLYKDWYMAGLTEIPEIMKVLGNSSMCGKTYWTPVEVFSWMGSPLDPAESAWKVSVFCPNAQPFPGQKTDLAYARPVRDF